MRQMFIMPRIATRRSCKTIKFSKGIFRNAGLYTKHEFRRHALLAISLYGRI